MIQLDITKADHDIYLDHAATTPVDPRVFEVMRPYYVEEFGNPSSIYQLGVSAKAALEEARTRAAFVLGASGHEVYFMSGGTESINTALQGVARAHGMKGTIITTAIEHHATLRTLEFLETQGLEVVRLPADESGVIDPKDLAKALTKDTILVSIMHANNEVGTIQPIKESARVIRETEKNFKIKIAFHTDACQSAGYLNINVEDLGVDLLSLNGSKVYGPKSAGLLYVRKATKIQPLLFGGNQEQGLRSGTENVAGAVGLSHALSLAHEEAPKEVERLTVLRDHFFDKLASIKNLKINGSREPRLPNNINVSLDDLRGEALVTYLDDYRIQASTGSACTSTEIEPSHVLLSMGRTEKEAEGSVRFSLGRSTTKNDIDYVADVFEKLVARLREMKA